MCIPLNTIFGYPRAVSTLDACTNCHNTVGFRCEVQGTTMMCIRLDDPVPVSPPFDFSGKPKDYYAPGSNAPKKDPDWAPNPNAPPL